MRSKSFIEIDSSMFEKTLQKTDNINNMTQKQSDFSKVFR